MDCNLSPGLVKKSAGCFGAFFFLIIFVPLAAATEAVQPDARHAEIGFSLLRFNYSEYKDDGSTWDRELGGILGGTLRFAQRSSDWEWEGTAGLHYGRVDYAGETSLGAPYNTRTDEMIVDGAVRLGCWFDVRYPVMPYAGIGYRQWDRNILPGGVGGLFESYRWPYAWLGAKIVAQQDAESQLILDIGLLQPISPGIHIDFKGTYNAAPVVYPESKTGLRVMVTANWTLAQEMYLTLEPYCEYWELGRSPLVTTGGVSVYEPASKTSNIGLNVRLGRSF